MRFIIKCKALYWLIQFTWGILMNTAGILVTLALLVTCHKPKSFGPLWYFEVGGNWGGFELGCCFVIGRDSSLAIKYHEAGHSIQNIMFGPLMPFLVSIPSAIRYWYRELKFNRKGKMPTTKYDDIWFEGQATRLGNKYFSEL